MIFVLVPRYPISPPLFSDVIQIAQNLFLLPCEPSFRSNWKAMKSSSPVIISLIFLNRAFNKTQRKAVTRDNLELGQSLLFQSLGAHTLLCCLGVTRGWQCHIPTAAAAAPRSSHLPANNTWGAGARQFQTSLKERLVHHPCVSKYFSSLSFDTHT